MTQTDSAAANAGGEQQNLTSLRLPELRKIAADKGLKGVSGLRKGDLITAIQTGSVPTAKKEAAPTAIAEAPQAAAPQPEASQAETTRAEPAKASRRRVVKRTAPAQQETPVPEEAPTRAETAEAAAPQAETPRHETNRHSEPAREQHRHDDTEDSSDQDGSEGSADDDGRYESRSAARRARRNRARQSQRERSHHEPRDSRDDRDEQRGQQSEAQEDHESPARQDQQQEAEHSPEQQGNQRPQRGTRDFHRDSNREQGERREERSRDSRDSRNDRDEQRGQQQRNDRNDRDEHDEQRGQQQRNDRHDRNDRDEHDGDRRGRRNRRGRRTRNDRNDRDHRDHRNERDTQQHDDSQQHADNLQDVAGILDILDQNTAFVRTTGYHASAADVFVPNQLIRKFGLRRGDAVTGQVKMSGAGNSHQGGRGNRQKWNSLVRVDSANGLSLEEARKRPDFAKLTPLYPNQRLRLETDSKILTTRVIDLIMPIGKGQRALIVSPPKAGKTTIMQNIANAISTNNPECYLMVVLVDERPEEVTDMQRSVNGEVIASTFDRPPGEHTAVAELAIERAKRLVEQGKDVVVLLDSITRLGRAYNNSSPASGRILSGGVDSNALYPPKRFLGAARNIENGGSLTIIATAMVETGSAGDTVIFEEFKGTGNAELKLDRKISERRVFPAVDVNPSGTRKDELLLQPDEARIMHKLRRILSALDNQQAIDLLIKQLKKTKSNGEFLLQVASSAPMAADMEDEDYS
ncbi:hypothetical protein COCCU_05700 [Corynebacterium occultum]|uniref:Transcription termination factor Rho n=1 Tax=Corynebacterium occultum TaxID=2675219 RepID=A0A6B8W0N8_9CORY|nr:transcription termination factor Rho [Corynebacterium occultum]QGU07084.1 hypothetical protein COCCU_05700 [Corynebacterium occultum]